MTLIGTSTRDRIEQGLKEPWPGLRVFHPDQKQIKDESAKYKHVNYGCIITTVNGRSTFSEIGIIDRWNR